MLPILGLIFTVVILAIGSVLYLLLGHSAFTRFAVTEPIRGAVLSILGVIVFALMMGIIITIVDIVLRVFHIR